MNPHVADGLLEAAKKEILELREENSQLRDRLAELEVDMSNDTKREIPDRIWMSPKDVVLYAQPEHLRDPCDTLQYARVHQPDVQAAEAIETVVDNLLRDWIEANPSLVGELEIQVVRDLSNRITAALAASPVQADEEWKGQNK